MLGGKESLASTRINELGGTDDETSIQYQMVRRGKEEAKTSKMSPNGLDEVQVVQL